MEDSKEFEYRSLGLPFALDQELTDIAELITDDNNIIDRLGRQIFEMNFSLDDLFQYDVDVFRECETYENEESEELGEFIIGMEVGYTTMFGLITYLRFKQSEFEEVDQYMESLFNNPESIPAITKNQIRRIKHIRTGQALVDVTIAGVVDDSTELPEFELHKYTLESQGIEDIKDRLIEHLTGGKDEVPTNVMLATFFEAGFEHGFANALQIYIASEEQRILDSLS